MGMTRIGIASPATTGRYLVMLGKELRMNPMAQESFGSEWLESVDHLDQTAMPRFIGAGRTTGYDEWSEK
jgi:hypothetical protein